MGSLRSAYLQREKSGEGLAFFPLELALIAGSLVASFGAVGLLVGGIGRRGAGRTLCVGAAVLVIASIVTSFGVFQRVINQSGCIGACGWPPSRLLLALGRLPAGGAQNPGGSRQPDRARGGSAW